MRGALWALDRVGLRTWKGVSGESQGKDVDEEETALDFWHSAKGVERCFGSTVSTEGGHVINTGNKT